MLPQDAQPQTQDFDASCVIWFTGLPGAGKTTLANRASEELARRGIPREVLDGDRFRSVHSPTLGYSREDRAVNVLRLAEAAADLAASGRVALVAAIAPYEGLRRAARQLVERRARFVEVYVSTPLQVCMHRDPKGLYRRAVAGEIGLFTGVSDPYEPPLSPELDLDTTDVSVDESIGSLTEALQRLGLLRSP